MSTLKINVTFSENQNGALKMAVKINKFEQKKKMVNFQKNYITCKINDSKFFYVFMATENKSNKIWYLAIFWLPF